jgi:tetratricopeptide (TPR) repeat protein
MKLKIVTFLACLFLASAARAADVEPLLDKALESLVRNLYVGDTSTAEGYLRAVLERDPDHVEAQWQVFYIKLVSVKNVKLSDRSEMLAALAPDFTRIAKLAKQTNQTAFLHFATAMYASVYYAHDRALSEIDQAIAAEPKSARYLAARGRIRAASEETCSACASKAGKNTGPKRDQEIEKGVVDLKKARELLQTSPSKFLTDEALGFYLGNAVSELSRPRWDEVVGYYSRYIERTPPSTARAYAADALSVAYRRMGECRKAKESAENALKYMEFGSAQFNKRMADFCIEMQKMGIVAAAAAAPQVSSSK